MFCRFVVLVAAGASLAAAADVRVIEEIAAKVNGDIITRGDLEEQKRQTEQILRQEQKLQGPQLQQAVNEASKDFLRDKIDELLLVQRAKDLNISVDSDVTRRLNQMQVQAKITDPDKFHQYIHDATGIEFEEYKQKMTNAFLTQRVISQEVGSHMVIPDADLRKYYEAHKQEFVRQEQVFLSQILLSTEGKTPEQAASAQAKAKDLVARARKGEKFSDLAAANSDDVETARNGGQLPPRGRGMSLKPIEDVIWKEKKGYVSDPITIAGVGIVIIKIDERFEAGQASFDEVKDQINDKLSEPKMAPKVRELLTRLRQQAFLQVKDGYVDSGAAPGKDTHWQEVASLKPQTVTKEEVMARRKRKRFLGVIPHGKKPEASSSDIDTSTLGTPQTQAAPAPVKQ